MGQRRDGGKAVLAEGRDLRKGGMAGRTGFRLTQEQDSPKNKTVKW